MSKFFCKGDSTSGKNLLYKVIDADSQLEARQKFDILLDEIRRNNKEVIHIKVEVYSLDETSFI